MHRVNQIQGIDETVVAIPDTTIDDVLVPHLRAMSANIFRGPHHDVLLRYHQAAMVRKASVIMRITADCPLLSPELCGEVLGRFMSDEADYDYCSNTVPRTFPRGLDCEVFSWRLLDFTNAQARRESDREHVTLWMLDSWNRPKVKVGSVVNSREDNSQINWSLDTPEDYLRICRVMQPKPQIASAVRAT